MKVYTTLGDGIEALNLTDVEAPQPKADEILVKIKAVSLNYRDLLVINGKANWKPLEPRIPVSDGVGEILAAGEKVRKWKPGDMVAGIFLPRWLDGKLTPEKYVSPLGGAAKDGVLAERVIFNEQSVVAVPGNLTDEESAELPVAAITAWHAVARRSRVQAGEMVLIQGTGGVSLFALQFVRALEGLPVVISSSDEKLERVKKLGAFAAVNYKTFPNWEEKILEITDGKGVDHVVEVIGGENLNRSLEAVKLGGTISFIGLIAGLSAPVNTYQFVQKNVTIHGIETGSREMFEEMNAFIEKQEITPVIDQVFDFQRAKEALKYLESGSHFGKIVVKVAD